MGYFSFFYFWLAWDFLINTNKTWKKWILAKPIVSGSHREHALFISFGIMDTIYR